MRRSRLALAVAVLAVTCGCREQPSSAPRSAVVVDGGTLHVFTQDDPTLDPGRAVSAQDLDLGRLVYRTLTTNGSTAETASAVVPDLATDTGRTSDSGRTWTFTLKAGLTYEDGSPITSYDVKYGFERAMADVVDTGTRFLIGPMLVGGDTYPGPYKDHGAGLASIETPDARTIAFHLTRPRADFPYITTRGAFSPIPRASDPVTHPDSRLPASGPYRITRWAHGHLLVLERNPRWPRATDPVRRAAPDRFLVHLAAEPRAVDQRMLDAKGDDASAVTLIPVQPAQVPEALALQRSGRAYTGYTGAVEYFFLNTRHKPLDDVRVRQAVNACTDREALRRSSVRSLADGEITAQVLPPTVAGYRRYDPFDSGGTGNVTRGKQLLAEANVGKVRITVQYPDIPLNADRVAALEKGLARCGITVTSAPIDASGYFATVGDRAREGDVAWVQWTPDWPSASTVLQTLFDSRTAVPQGNLVLSQPAGSLAAELDSEIDAINQLSDQSAVAARWGALDRRITDLALTDPFFAVKAVMLRGGNVRGTYFHTVFQGPDLVSLGLRR
jgi:peptide/nickel transport system substrate-binding protein